MDADSLQPDGVSCLARWSECSSEILASLILVAMPGAPSSVLVTTSKALVTRSDALVTSSVLDPSSDGLHLVRSLPHRMPFI